MSPDTKIFVSHATEDKDEFVRPLAEELRKHCHIWYDEYSLPFGASIFHSISAGLSDCDFGIVVLTNSFFGKKWTQDEIAGLSALEEPNRPKIIPIWRGVTKEQVQRFSPILADRLAINGAKDIPEIIRCISDAVGDAASGATFVFEPAPPTDPRALFADLGRRINEHHERVEMNRSPDAPRLVQEAQNSLFQEAEAEVEQIALANPKFKLSWASGGFRCIPNDIIWFNITLPNGDIVRMEATRPSRTTDQLRLDFNVFRPKRDERGNYTYPDHLEDYRFSPELEADGTVIWRDAEGNSVLRSDIIVFFLTRLHSHVAAIFEPRIGG